MSSLAAPSVRTTRVPSSAAFDITETCYEPCAILARHYHARASVSLVFAGGQQECVGRRAYACPPLSVVFKTAELDHCDEVGHAGMHGLFIELAPETHNSLADAFQRPPDVACLRDAHFQSLVKRIRHEVRFRSDGAELAIEGLIYELLAAVARRGGNTGGVNPRAMWLARARDFLKDHFSERLSLMDVATEVRVHPSHLAHAFRSAYGCTVGQYLRTLRVEHAQRLLLGHARRVSDIALKAGFADQAHLTRVFRQHVGVTPAEFRRLTRG